MPISPSCSIMKTVFLSPLRSSYGKHFLANMPILRNVQRLVVSLFAEYKSHLYSVFLVRSGIKFGKRL